MAGLLDYASSVAGEAKKNVQGLLADPKQALKDILNNLALKAAAQQAATKAAWATRDPKIMAKNALDSSQTALGFAPLGITAWHGSPHTFDKFSLDAIGTGEGAQAYGHGLYLAESPKVAKSYQDLAKRVGPQVDGAPLNKMNASFAESALTNMYQNRLAAGLPPDIAATQTAKWGETHPQIGKDVADSFVQRLAPPPNGSLYKTDIPDEAVARFLDWDKPLSQQAPEVLAQLQRSKNKQIKAMLDFANKEYQSVPGEFPTAGEAFKLMSMNHTGRASADSAKASALLAQQGIPGIRYLDEGSRNTTQRYIAKHPMGGESVFNTQPELDAFIKRNPVFKAINPNLTSNYVAFDPEMIRILERNGQSTGAVPWQPGEWRGLLGNN